MLLDLYYQNPNRAIRYRHSCTDPLPDPDFHLHDSFEIYFFLAGDVNYFIEKQIHPLQTGDLLVMNSHEIHKPTFLSKHVYERITVHFEPIIPQMFNYDQVDLLRCFTARPKGMHNRIHLETGQIEQIMFLFSRIEQTEDDNTYGAAVLKLNYFLELLVLINRAFHAAKPVEPMPHIPEKLVPVLDFIEQHLEEDLSLNFLEEQFYLNRFYLSRLFKQSTGSSIHDYIIYKRISKAKKLLAEGSSVTEACHCSGFKDYSNFIRTFKKKVGIAPGGYKKQIP